MDSDARSNATGITRSRILLALVALTLMWAIVIWASGGIDWTVGWFHVRSRGPLRPALVVLGLALLYLASSRRLFTSDIDWMTREGARRAGLLAAALALAVACLAWSSTSVVAGGADAYGYVSQAYLWLGGRLTVAQPIVRDVPWPFADLTFTPLGYRPAIGGGALVPTYGPGLPMLMALGALVAGDCGPFLIVPLLGGLAIWLTYRLGRELWSPWHGLAAALVLAVSPAFVYMLMWPMSDVPVAAFWLAATTSAVSRGRWRWLRTGGFMSAAILVRPNLAPLVLPFAMWAVGGEGGRGERRRQLAWLVAGLLPGVLAIAVIHTHLYGAPWRSGYGGLDALYAWGHLSRNLSRYPRWLLDTETPLVVAMLVPIAVSLRGQEGRDSRVLLLAAVIAGVWASYLFYAPFDDWWYLRFLLPAFPLMLLLSVHGWTILLSQLRPPLHALALVAVTVGWATHGASRIGTERMFDIGAGEQSYIRVAQFVVDRLPPNALLLSMQHSGSLRYYAGRLTMRYDWLGPEWWPRALDVLVGAGFRPFFVVDEWEEPLVRRRFRGSSAGDDVLGCLVARETRVGGTRIYDPMRGAWCGPVRIEPFVAKPCRHPVPMTGPAGGGTPGRGD